MSQDKVWLEDQDVGSEVVDDIVEAEVDDGTDDEFFSTADEIR